MRFVMTRVFPLPAPASSNMGPSTCATASFCWGFRPSRKSICGGECAFRITSAASRTDGKLLNAFGLRQRNGFRSFARGPILKDEGAHAPFEAAQTIIGSLFKRALVVPVIVADPIAGDHGAGAVAAMLAMDKHRPVLRIVEQAKNLRDLLLLRSIESRERNSVVFHSERLDLFLLRSGSFPAASQIDDRAHSEFCEIVDAVARWLTAAIDMIVHLPEVMNAAGIAGGKA